MISERIKFLALIDLFAGSAYGLLLPILPLFLRDVFSDSDIQSIAFAYAIYLASMAGFAWIFGIFIEHGLTLVRIKLGLVFGTLILTLAPIAFIKAVNMNDIYLIQIAIGLGFGIMKTAWSRLAHSKLEDFSACDAFIHTRSLLATFTLALSAVIGGYMAYRYGYHALLTLMFAFGFTTFIISFIYILSPEKTTKKRR